MHTCYLEYDAPRAGRFEPLQHLLRDKNVVLGFFTTKFPALSDIGEMEERVRNAVGFTV